MRLEVYYPQLTPDLDDVAALVGLQLGRRTVRASDRIVEDLGAESADVVNIAAAVEDRWGVFLDETALARVSTVADLHALIRRSG